MAAAAEYLAARSRDPMTVGTVAQAMGYSVSHARRLFTRVSRASPNRYLAALRVEDAKTLLAETDLSVLEICHRVGYDSLGTFTRRFSEAVGVQPGRFRHLVRSAEVDPASRAPQVTGPSGGVSGSVRGTVRLEPDSAGTWSPAWVGIFPRPVPVGRPLAGAVVPDGAAFEIPLPDRRCWLLAASFPRGRRGRPLVAQLDRSVVDGDVVDLLLQPWQRHFHPLTFTPVSGGVRS